MGTIAFPISPLPFREGGPGGIGLTVASGTLIAPTLAKLFAELDALAGTSTRVVPIRNDHFGPRINVSGLLTTQDVITQLKQQPLGDVICLPRTSLDYFGRKFLDDGTPADVERALGRPVLFASTMSEAVEELEAYIEGAHPAPATPAATNGKYWGRIE